MENVNSVDERTIAVQSLLACTIEAWRTGDATTYAECFSEDCVYIAFFGSVYRGQEAIERSHRALFSGPLKNTQLFVEQADLRFLSEEVAILVTRGDSAKKPPSKLTKVQTYIAAKKDGDWKFIHFQNTKRSALMRLLTSFAGPDALPASDCR